MIALASSTAYVQLSRTLGIPLLTTDRRLARAYEQAEMIEA